MIPSARPCLAVLAATALSLGLGACSVSFGGPGSSSGSRQAPSQQESPSAPQQEDTMASAQAPASAAGQAAAPDATQSPAQQPTADGGTAQASGARPGASATITDPDWLSAQDSMDKTIQGSGAVLIDGANEHIHVEGDVATLTITGGNATIVADYVDTLVIKGPNADVYVRDVNKVVLHGNNAEVVWAGDTPMVEDFGANNEFRLQGTQD